MQEYISTIIYICIFSIILELILPENKLKKYVGVLVSLVIILTLASPVINVLETDNVVATISTAIENIQSKVDHKEYDFSNIGNKLIFSSVKEDLEDEIQAKCNDKFGSAFEVKKVKISLDEKYELKNIDVHVIKLPEVARAGEIIDFISNEYSIQASIIKVVREE